MPVSVSAPPRRLIRWVGGKSRLLPILDPYLAAATTGLCDPFIGGGSIFAAFRAVHPTLPCVIGDANPDLIALYQSIQSQPDEVWQFFQSLSHEIESSDTPRTTYERIRAWDRAANWAERTPIERAARLLVIVRFGFNGLVRVNRHGYCNTPWSADALRRPLRPDRDTILRWSHALAYTRIIGGDFRQTLAAAPVGSTVYLDPPYVDTFDGYTAQGFTEHDFHDVCHWAETLRTTAHCRVILSHLSFPHMTEWFSPDHWHIIHTRLTHQVGGPASARRDAHEVIVVSRVPNRTVIQLALPFPLTYSYTSEATEVA